MDLLIFFVNSEAFSQSCISPLVNLSLATQTYHVLVVNFAANYPVTIKEQNVSWELMAQGETRLNPVKCLVSRWLLPL